MKKVIFILLLIQMTAPGKAQSFEYIYSTPDDEVIADGVEDSAGNYYLVGLKGTFLIFGYGYYDGLIIKLNPAGDTIKTAIIPAINNTLTLERIIEVNDSTYIVMGEKQMPGTTDIQICYWKIDNNLNILDHKTFGDTSYRESVMRAYCDKQNNILLAGFAADSITYKVIFYKMNYAGDSLQSFYLGDSIVPAFGFDVLDLPDSSGYLIFTHNWYIPQPLFVHNEILKINNSGMIDTIAIINDSEFIISAMWLSDSSFIISCSGYRPTGPNFDWDLRFRKYDLNFNILADTLIGQVDTFETEAMGPFDFLNPNKIFAGGTVNYQNNWFGNGDPAYFLLAGLDNNLNPQWKKIISHNDDYLNLYKVLATKDGGVLLAGTSYNDQTSGPNERDIYVIKLDSLGNFTTGINHPTGTTQVHEVIVYPNPAQDIIHINSTIHFKATDFRLFDSSGREVMDKKFSKAASFSVKELRAGIYFYEIKGEKGKTERGKVVKTD